MNKQTILQVSTQGKSPTLNHPQEPPQQEQPRNIRPDRPDCAGVSPSGSADKSFIPSGEGVRPDDVDDANRAGLTQMDQPRHKTESSSAAYREVHAESIQALLETLTEVHSLRDECFRDNLNSRSGLLLAQTTLILERIECGIPSGREAFVAILRAARLPESVPEAAEPTTEMAESPV